MSFSNEGAATSTPLMAHHHFRPPTIEPSRKKKVVDGGGAVRYMECLKNHATNIGGNATDGCGEFMAGGEEGTLEALICCACDCHRNFHRKIQMVSQRSDPAGVLKMMPVVRDCDVELRHRHEMAEEGEESSGLKRFRSKFTQEQKEKMQGFAKKVGWKLQTTGDAEVRSFCEEIGVKKKILKVWMHNNKYKLTNKIIDDSINS